MAGNHELQALIAEAAHRLVDDVAAHPEQKAVLCQQFAQQMASAVETAIESKFKAVAADYGLYPTEN